MIIICLPWSFLLKEILKMLLLLYWTFLTLLSWLLTCLVQINRASGQLQRVDASKSKCFGFFPSFLSLVVESEFIPFLSLSLLFIFHLNWSLSNDSPSCSFIFLFYHPHLLSHTMTAGSCFRDERAAGSSSSSLFVNFVVVLLLLSWVKGKEVLVKQSLQLTLLNNLPWS